jgi:hypothetical protein
MPIFEVEVKRGAQTIATGRSTRLLVAVLLLVLPLGGCWDGVSGTWGAHRDEGATKTCPNTIEPFTVVDPDCIAQPTVASFLTQ